MVLRVGRHSHPSDRFPAYAKVQGDYNRRPIKHDGGKKVVPLTYSFEVNKAMPESSFDQKWTQTIVR